jgi:hypothetical protein
LPVPISLQLLLVEVSHSADCLIDAHGPHPIYSAACRKPQVSKSRPGAYDLPRNPTATASARRGYCRSVPPAE